MKKIVVIGNCQASPITQMIKHCAKNVEITGTLIAHKLKNSEDDLVHYNDILEKSDIIVTQNISDTYPIHYIRTNDLVNKYGGKVVRIVNLYLRYYNPEQIYIRVPGLTINGPLDAYHNSTIFDCWQSQIPLQECREMVVDIDFNRDKYATVVSNSLLELKNRLNNSHIKFYDFIEKNVASVRLFHTINHPTSFLLYNYVKSMMVYLQSNFDIQYDESIEYQREILNGTYNLTNPFVLQDLCDNDFVDYTEIKGYGYSLNLDSIVMNYASSVLYQTSELVDNYYQLYDAISNKLSNFRVNYD